MNFPEKYTIETLKKHLQSIHPEIELISNNYIDNDSIITVRCKIHGNEWETTAHRLSQQKFACRKCYDEYRTNLIKEKKEKDFLAFLQKNYEGIYDFSKVKYINNKTKVTLICPEHGEFSLRPDKMINRLDGCPYCKESHLERRTAMVLSSNNVSFKRQKTYEWLTNKSNLFLDFYLEKYNVSIECQGEQHIINRDSILNKNDSFNEKVERDLLKNRLCEEHGIRIIYIFNKIHSSYRLNEQFNHLYDAALFIEDIEKDNSILIKEIKRDN